METLTSPDYQNLNQNTFQNLPQKNNYKILFLIFFDLFILSLITIIIFAIFSFSQKSPASSVGKIIEEELIPTPTPSEPSEILAETKPESKIPKDWKTYTNKTFGVSFQYPVNYEVNINTTLSELYITEITEEMAPWFNVIKVNNEDLATFIKNNSEYKKTDFMIGNQKGIRFRSTGPEEIDFIYLTTGTSNYKFLTELTFDDDLFTQILSTFKFI